MTTIDPDRVRDEVREKYAAAALAVSDDAAGCCGSSSGCGTSACCDGSATRRSVATSTPCRPGRAAGRCRHGQPRLRHADRGRRPGRRRDRPRPRLGRRHRRAPVGAPGRPGGQGVRPRHDRRDARPRAPQRGGGRRVQRRVPEGRDRGHPAGGRDGRRDHLELRHQPLAGQARRVRRDAPRAAAGRPHRRSPTSSPRTASTRRRAPSAAATSAVSPARSRAASTRRCWATPASATSASRSRTRWRTACTARSSRRAVQSSNKFDES